MNDTGRHSGLFSGRINGRACGRFAGRTRSVLEKKTAVAPPSEWDADFLAFWERTRGTPDSWKEAYNNLFVSLKGTGIFDKSDVIRIYCGYATVDVLLNLKSSNYTAIEVNSPTFMPKTGYIGNGSGYIRENFKPVENGSNYSQNNAAFTVFLNSPITGGAWESVHGAVSSNIYYAVNGNYYTTGLLGNMNGVSYDLPSIPSAPASRVFSMRRNLSTAFNIYNNGASDNVTMTSAWGASSVEFYTLAHNASGTAQHICSSAVSEGSVIIGSYLTDTELADFDIIITQFKSDIASL